MKIILIAWFYTFIIMTFLKKKPLIFLGVKIMTIIDTTRKLVIATLNFCFAILTLPFPFTPEIKVYNAQDVEDVLKIKDKFTVTKDENIN